MDGVHDMGGMDGYGPIEREADEPVFHESWEARTITLSLGISCSLGITDDVYRRTIERIPPVDYLRASYYENWLVAIETVLREAAVVGPDETVSGDPHPRHPDCLLAADVPAVIAAGAPRRVIEADPPPARFQPGDQVQARNRHISGHTRLPRYVRGRRGRVVRDHGRFPLADAVAAGREEPPQRVYSVAFSARELWGPEARAGDEVVLDLWDAYLDPGH